MPLPEEEVVSTDIAKEEPVKELKTLRYIRLREVDIETGNEAFLSIEDRRW